MGPARFELLFSKRGGNTAFHRWAAKHFSEYDSFEAFVKGWLNSENIYEHTHFFPQHMFLYDETGSLAVDFLGRFEKLEKDFRHVRERLDGLGSDLQQLNTSKRSDYRTRYDDEMRAIVAEVYRTDIKLFGYEFEGYNSEAPLRTESTRGLLQAPIRGAEAAKMK